MGSIVVDKARFVANHHGEPDLEQMALWVFSIEGRDICFWGRYEEVVSTAELYAHAHGVDRGPITLVDCSGAAPGKVPLYGMEQ